MLELLNNYSPLIIAAIFGVVGYLNQRRVKKERAEQANLSAKQEEKKITEESLQALQKKEQLKKDSDLKKTLDNLNCSVERLDKSINIISDDVRKMNEEFTDFKQETKTKFTTISENGLLTMKYTRGLATVTLELMKNMGYDEKDSTPFNHLIDLSNNQDDVLLGALYRDIKK